MPGNRGKTVNQAAEAPDNMGYFHWFQGRPLKKPEKQIGYLLKLGIVRLLLIGGNIINVLPLDR
jgi:hypothetical protein